MGLHRPLQLTQIKPTTLIDIMNRIGLAAPLESFQMSQAIIYSQIYNWETVKANLSLRVES